MDGFGVVLRSSCSNRQYIHFTTEGVAKYLAAYPASRRRNMIVGSTDKKAEAYSACIVNDSYYQTISLRSHSNLQVDNDIQIEGYDNTTDEHYSDIRWQMNSHSCDE